MTVTEEMKKARRKAMSLLEHMDRTEKGLSERLRQAGFSAEAAEDAMNYVRMDISMIIDMHFIIFPAGFTAKAGRRLWRNCTEKA